MAVDNRTPEQQKLWNDMSAREEYIELHRAPWRLKLDGRFSIEELEEIVRTAKALPPVTNGNDYVVPPEDGHGSR